MMMMMMMVVVVVVVVVIIIIIIIIIVAYLGGECGRPRWQCPRASEVGGEIMVVNKEK
jgi:uncharacterized membrane protein